MFIVMGATGHIGSAVADTLLGHGEEVAVLTRRPERAGAWRDKGARVIAADAADAASLAAAFRLGTRAFLLNPPGDITGDPDAGERRTIADILAAVESSGLEKVVAVSTYGAQPGEAIADLGTLWSFEAGLRDQPVPSAVNRCAYFMSNWLASVDAVRTTGTLPSMFPADLAMPMVAPHDLGLAAADRLLSLVDDVDVAYVEGPERYTPRDVADAFAAVLGRDVQVEVIPRYRWHETYRRLGFSEEAARSFGNMTAATLDGGFDLPDEPRRGGTTLQAFIADAVGS